MSSLTKLFVVLLVILSLLTTAGTVVFVNQVGDLSGKLTTAQQQVSSMQVEVANAQQALSAQRDLAQSATAQANSEIEKMRQSMNQLQQRMNELSGQNADLTSRIALQSADSTRITEALKAAQDMVSKQSEQIVTLRTTNDDRLKQNVELNTAVTDLTDRYQVTERERRNLAEQLAEATRTVDGQRSMLKDAGINPKMVTTSGNGAGAPPINGVIRNVRNFAGVPYASISVGGNDGVTKGMEFKVVDRASGDFLGVLTIDSVEPTESTGRVSGPGVSRIKPGVAVKTQI